MNAEELLYNIQLLGKTQHSNRDFLKETKRDLAKKYPGVISKLENSVERMPTDYQDSHFFDIIKDSFNILKETVLNKNIKFGEKIIKPEPIPLFGTVDIDGCNAFIRVLDNDNKVAVIVFNNILLMFTQRLMEIYTTEHWLTMKKQMNKYFQVLLTKNFIDVMLCLHLFNNPYYALPLFWSEIENLDYPEKFYDTSSVFDDIFGNEEYLLFEHQISNSTYLWIASHEYAHLILGHLNDDNEISKLGLSDFEVNKILFAQQQEFDADLLGAIITMESESSFFAANGIYFALNCLFLSNIDKIETSMSSHPPIKDRINNIFEKIKFNKEYLISNYRIIDEIFVPKYQMFKKLLLHIDSENVIFHNVTDMQKYIYKEYDFGSYIL